MKKRWLAGALALGMLLTTAPAAFATDKLTSYSDVDAGAWCEEAIAYVSSRGIMNGVGYKFAPNDTLDRSVAAQLIYNLNNDSGAYNGLFYDITGWHGRASKWATSEGLIEGLSAGIFVPDQAITRERLIVALYRFAKMKGLDVSAAADLSAYADCGSISADAADAMSWAVAAGLITGTEGGGLAPQASITRAETALVLMTFCQTVC